jgi:hypothetical protein
VLATLHSIAVNDMQMYSNAAKFKLAIPRALARIKLKYDLFIHLKKQINYKIISFKVNLNDIAYDISR